MYWKNSSSGEVFWGHFKIHLCNEYAWKDLKKRKKKHQETKKPKMLQLYTLLFRRVLGLHIFILPRLSDYSTDVYTWYSYHYHDYDVIKKTHFGYSTYHIAYISILCFFHSVIHMLFVIHTCNVNHCSTFEKKHMNKNI